MYDPSSHRRDDARLVFKLAGPKQRRASWWDPWILIWYPLIASFRMARIFSATTWTYFSTGILLYNCFTKIGYNFSEDIFNWLIWIVSISSATAIYQFFIPTNVILWWFILLTHGMDKKFWWITLITNETINKSYKPQISHRAASRKHFDTEFIISAYNCNLLLLSYYTMYPCTVFELSNTMNFDTMVHISDYTDHVRKITAPPCTWLLKCYSLQPPQGFILEIMLFSAAIFATAISFSILCSCIKRHKHVVRPKQRDIKQAYFNVTTAFQ